MEDINTFKNPFILKAFRDYMHTCTRVKKINALRLKRTHL